MKILAKFPLLTYANLVATLALFIALGGTSYAAITVTGKNVKDGSLTGKDVKDGSIAKADLSKDASSLGAQGPRGADGANGAGGTNGAPGATGPTGASEEAEPTTSARLSGGPKTEEALCEAISNNQPRAIGWGVNEYAYGGATATSIDMCGGPLPSGLRAPKDGIYSVGVGLGWENTNSTGRREIALVVNNYTYVADESIPAHTGVQFQTIHTTIRLAENDVVKAVAVQDSGGALDFFAAGRGGLWLHYEGPLD
jgi:hypothetical protein